MQAIQTKYIPNYRSPSAAALEREFPGEGKMLKAILLMSRDELDSLPAGNARNRECYHRPTTSDVRLHCLNAAMDGAFGVESFETSKGEAVQYLNTGDTYSPTICRFRGNYLISSWGDLAEKHGSR
jgi:hypothetical protein